MWKYQNNIAILIICSRNLQYTVGECLPNADVCENVVYFLKSYDLRLCPSGFTCSDNDSGGVAFYVKFSSENNIHHPKNGKSIFIIDNGTNLAYTPPWPNWIGPRKYCNTVSFSLVRIERDESNCFICIWTSNNRTLVLSFNTKSIETEVFNTPADRIRIATDSDTRHEVCFSRADSHQQRKSFDWQQPDCSRTHYASATKTALIKYTNHETTIIRSATKTVTITTSIANSTSTFGHTGSSREIRSTTKKFDIPWKPSKEYTIITKMEQTTKIPKKVDTTTDHPFPNSSKNSFGGSIKTDFELHASTEPGIDALKSIGPFGKIGTFKILPTCQKTRSMHRKSRGILYELYHVNRNCSPMGEWPQTIARCAHALGEVWLITCSSISMVVMFVVREKSFERKIHMFQELLLITAHVSVVFLAQRTDSADLCYMAALLLQYLFLCLALLLFLEIVQCYYILTNLIWHGSAVGGRTAAAFILFFPLILVLVTKLGPEAELTSVYSCWLNYGSQATAFGTTIPLLTLVSTCYILMEDAQMRHLPPMFNANKRQRKMAFVNLVSMWIKLPLHIASFLLTSFTIYVQRFEFFTATFAMNVSLGVSIIVFHVGTSEKANQFWKRLNSMCPKKRNLNK